MKNNSEKIEFKFTAKTLKSHECILLIHLNLLN